MLHRLLWLSLTAAEAIRTLNYPDEGAIMDFDADKNAGERQGVASRDDPEKRIWHRPRITKIPVKEIVLQSSGSLADGGIGTTSS